MTTFKKILGVIAVMAVFIGGIATFTAYIRSIEYRLHNIENEIVVILKKIEENKLKIFNEEERQGDVILIMEPKEVVSIIDAVSEGIKSRPRKVTWKKMLDELKEKCYVYY